MAGIVNKRYDWDVTVVKGTAAVDSANFFVWDADSTGTLIDLTTDASGKIPLQQIDRSVTTVTLADTTSVDFKTPHIVSVAKYGNKPLGTSVTFDAKRTDTFFTETDPFLTDGTRTLALGQSGIVVAHDSDSIALTTTLVTSDVYDYTQGIAETEPQKDFPSSIMRTADGNNYQVDYSMILRPSGDFNGNNASFAMTSPAKWSLEGGDIINTTVTGNADLTVPDTYDTLSITGDVTFTDSGTWNFSNGALGTLVNTSGGDVVVNLVNTTFDSNAGPNITVNNNVGVSITALDGQAQGVLNARVFVEEVEIIPGAPGGGSDSAPTISASTGYYSTATATSHTLTYPSDSGDRIYMFLGAGSNVSFTPPPAWTKLYDAANGTSTVQSVYYKDDSAGATGTFSVGVSSSSHLAAAMVKIRGDIDPTTTLPDFDSAEGLSTGANPPNVSVTNAPKDILVLTWNVANTTGNPTPGAGYTEVQGGSTTAGVGGCIGDLYERRLDSASAEDPPAWLFITVSSWISTTNIFAAAPSGPPGPDSEQRTTLFNGLTDSSGQATFQYNYGTADADIEGVIRKGQPSPIFKSKSFTGVITTSGFSTTETLISDE